MEEKLEKTSEDRENDVKNEKHLKKEKKIKKEKTANKEKTAKKVKIGKKMEEMHRINKRSFVAYTILTVILLFAYLLEFVKGSRTLEYTLIFGAIDVIPYIMYILVYKKDRTSNKLKYILSIGFSIMYAFVLLTAAVPTTFVYIFMIYIVIIPYGDIVLCYITGGIALAANIVSVAVGFSNGDLGKGDLAMVEIQLIAILLGALFVGFATNVIGKVNAQKLEELNDEKLKTETLLTNTLNLSKSISNDIDSVTDRMEQLRNSVITTKESMEDVSAGANETAESLQEQLLQTEEIVAQLDKANDVTSAITSDVSKTHETVLIGKNNINSLLESVNKSEATSNTVAVRMNELVENTKKMNEIVEMINSITSQTRLLSLNASIEAARAGESGRGFAVVADEISTLAGQTNEATVNITNLITDITSSIQEVFDSIKLLMENNKEQNQAVETMAETFEKIQICASNINEVSADLEQVMAELSKKNESIVTGINTVSAVTEEVSARATETLSGSENDAIVVDEITDVIVNLNEKAKQLNN